MRTKLLAILILAACVLVGGVAVGRQFATFADDLQAQTAGQVGFAGRAGNPDAGAP